MSIGSATLADNKQADCQQGYIKGIGRLNKRNFLFVAGGFALFTVLQLSSKQNRIAIKASPDIKKWHKDDSCQGCDLELFTADMKYDSKTGWPSFSDHIHGHLETYTDLKGIWPKTGYRCARCGGHHGHLIMDGPLPSGQRWCNNGQVLKFTPA